MSTDRVDILCGRVPPDAPPDEQDVLAEVAVVRAALRDLGWKVGELAVGLDLETAAAALRERAPAFVFNLVESLEGRGRHVHLVPALLESLGIPFTGAPLEGLFLASAKLTAKRLLDLAGIPTPAWMGAADAMARLPAFPPPWIVKSSWEHASIGLEDSAVVRDGDALRAEILRRAAREAVGELYLEAFIDGREFNLSVLGGSAAGPRVMPPAEIEFLGFPDGKPRMVGYRAKWMPDAPEYGATPRRFDLPSSDARLAATLESIATACWRLFGLRGYARVDFRVDREGRPWVLEVNANPCLSEDAGFAAAAARAGLDMREVVAAIVREAIGKESP